MCSIKTTTYDLEEFGFKLPQICFTKLTIFSNLYDQIPILYIKIIKLIDFYNFNADICLIKI